jgi:putative acetyltransferase
MGKPTTVRLRTARDRASIALVARMFREYADGLGFPLDFQGFHHEVASLPGEYAPPRGSLILAFVGSHPAGCVGVRPIDPVTAEMKRLFVRNEFRGEGVGRQLVDRVLADARRIGYQRMRLDTVPEMTEAIRLYRRRGFVEIAPYRYNPIPGALYFEIDLRGLPAPRTANPSDRNSRRPAGTKTSELNRESARSRPNRGS